MSNPMEWLYNTKITIKNRNSVLLITEEVLLYKIPDVMWNGR